MQEISESLDSLPLGRRMDFNSSFGASSVYTIAIRLNVSCSSLLQIQVVATQPVGVLHSAVADALQPVGEDVILSWGCSLLSPSDDRKLHQIGISEGAVIECAIAVRGGMQGSAGMARSSKVNEQLKQCLSMVQRIQADLNTGMHSVSPPIVARDTLSVAGAKCSGRVEVQDSKAKVCENGRSVICIM